MLQIRRADEREYEAVRRFYYQLIDDMQDAEYHPAWEKGVYPADEYLLASLQRQELFVGTTDGAIVAAMVVNASCNESYQKARWQVQAAPEEVFVIHILGVHPSHAGRGYAKALARRAVEEAREAGRKAVRLDVLSGNLPAERLYAGLGFRYIETMPMYYQDTGWTDFKLYEYPL